MVDYHGTRAQLQCSIMLVVNMFLVLTLYMLMFTCKVNRIVGHHMVCPCKILFISYVLIFSVYFFLRLLYY